MANGRALEHCMVVVVKAAHWRRPNEHVPGRCPKRHKPLRSLAKAHAQRNSPMPPAPRFQRHSSPSPRGSPPSQPHSHGHGPRRRQRPTRP